jgi:site-specific DNA-cytosine methylase
MTTSRTLPASRALTSFSAARPASTSVAAAIHGYRTGESLWPEHAPGHLDLIRPEWVVVEQPPATRSGRPTCLTISLRAGYHVARLEFEARDVGAPYERRRVFILACPSLPRLEVAWKAGPSAIERVARAADARGAWDADILEALRVDARSAGEHDRGPRKPRTTRVDRGAGRQQPARHGRLPESSA